MKVFSQLEKAQLENTTSDTGSLPKGMITYRTDLNIAKVSNGTSMLALIDESSTQTLSGKTYASPSFTGAFTMAQTTTPSNPSSGSNRFYFKADGKLYTLDSSGNEALVGSGTGGVKNLITNGNADDTAASIFVPYADTGTRPVDGTGGSPTVTTSISSSTPLDGVKSFLLTKPASNVQGQGWAVPFTVDLAYRAKSLKISVDYIINSGTFVAGGAGVESDVIWYIYDVTNSQLIEPSNIKMFSNSTTLTDKFEATFQSSATGSSYRLIAHVRSTSASAFELKVDNVTVSPQIYVYGTPITDWADFTPIGSWTNTTYTGKYRYVGDEIELVYHLKLTGVPSGSLNLNVPSFAPINTSKLPASGDNLRAVGTWVTEDNGVQDYGGVAYLNPGSNLIGGLLNPTTGGIVTATAPYSFNTGDWIEFKISYPVSGKSSSVQLSDSADTRVLAAVLNLNASISSNPNNSLAIIPLNGAALDTHGAINTGTNRFVAPTAGFYQLNAKLNLQSANVIAGAEYYISVQKNGSETTRGTTYRGVATTGAQMEANALTYLNAGDFLQLALFSSANHSVNQLSVYGDTGGSYYTSLQINRVSGPSAIAASESVYASARNGSAQVIANNSIVNLTGWTIDNNSHNALATDGQFTAPISGQYIAYFQLAFNGASTGTRVARIARNGSDVSFVEYAGNNVSNFGTVAVWSGRLVAGDILRPTVYQTSGGNLSVSGNDNYNKWIIQRIGN